MSLDFTLEKYAQLCDTIQALSCPVMTVKQFLEAGQPQEFVVILRHDVDRSLPSAIRMAELEAKKGRSTRSDERLDLRVGKKELQSDIHSSSRRNVRKARKNNL